MNIIIKRCLSTLLPSLQLYGPSVRYSFSILEAKPHKKQQVPFKKWNIVRGDIVKVISGKDKTKVGKVTRVHRKANKITVKGVNIKVKKVKNPQTGLTVDKRRSYPIHVSNAGLYDSQAKRAVRIRYGFHAQTGEKLRISKRTGKILKKPEYKNLTHEKRGKKRTAGKKDTTSQFAHKVTYQGEDFQSIKRQFQAFIAEKQQKQKYLVFKE